MPFTFKLSQRLARMRCAVLLLSSAVFTTACEKPAASVSGPAQPGTQVVKVVVSPDVVTLLPSHSQQFTAFGRTQAGDSVAVAVTWSATAGSVSASGLYTAGAVAGVYEVTARHTDRQLSGKATVTVALTPVASVAVSPATASVQVGGTVQLTATPKDSTGSALSGRTVTWASGNAAVATVSGSGLVSAVAAGSATITATSEGKSGTASVTVTGGSVAAEGAAPQAGWLWCDDFEQDRLGQYFEYDNSGGQVVRATGVGVGGASRMRAQFAAGQMSAGALHLAIGREPSSYFRPVDAGTANYRELYWRMYVRTQAGGGGGGGYKLSRAISFASAHLAEAVVAHGWGGPPAPGAPLLRSV